MGAKEDTMAKAEYGGLHKALTRQTINISNFSTHKKERSGAAHAGKHGDWSCSVKAHRRLGSKFRRKPEGQRKHG